MEAERVRRHREIVRQRVMDTSIGIGAYMNLLKEDGEAPSTGDNFEPIVDTARIPGKQDL